MGKFKGRQGKCLVRRRPTWCNSVSPANKYSVSICAVCKTSFCSMHLCCEECHTNKVLLASLTPSQPASQCYCKRNLKKHFILWACIHLQSDLFPIITLEGLLSVLEDVHSWAHFKHSQLSQEKYLSAKQSGIISHFVGQVLLSFKKICLETIVSLRRVAARKGE